MSGGDDATLTAEGSRGRDTTSSGRFELLATIGRGGMGEVLEARDKQFGRIVALKRLPPEASAAARERFETEAIVTGRLEHSGIPPVYDKGELPDRAPYYAMRRIRGRTLEAALAACAGFAERARLVPTVARIARTVAFAHEQGVLHRDIKPANVIVGDHGDVVLLDWGLAKLRSGGSKDSETRAGEVMGTPAYMAPEQADGAIERIDARTDVFAIGALLYHVLTGRAPYGGGSGVDVVLQAAAADFVPVRQAASDVPDALASICERAMAREVDDRFASATELAAALEGALADALQRRDTAVDRVAMTAMMIVSAAAVFTAIALLREMVALDRQGAGVWSVIVTAAAGFGLAAIERATLGRHRLAPLVLACAIATLAIGVMAFAAGLGKAAGAAAANDHPEEFLVGIHECTGALLIAAGMSALLVLMWGVARRRELTSR